MDLLFCSVILPHQSLSFFYNGMPFDAFYCRILGFLQKWIMYGERTALAVIAINTTNVLKFPGEQVSLKILLIFPWLITFIYLAPITFELLPNKARFEYNPTLGECTVSNRETLLLLEILGSYLPFILMIFSYTRIHRNICRSQRNLAAKDSFVRYIIAQLITAIIHC